MKATEDPRTAAEYGGGYYSEEEDSSSCDSDGSSSESSPSSSREQWSGGKDNNNQENCYYQERNENNSNNNNNNNVLVVAGCKSCLMYYMVPKQLEICPKCCGQLLHFDRSENGSSWIFLFSFFLSLFLFLFFYFSWWGFRIGCWCGLWSFWDETKRNSHSCFKLFHLSFLLPIVLNFGYIHTFWFPAFMYFGCFFIHAFIESILIRQFCEPVLVVSFERMIEWRLFADLEILCTLIFSM